MTTIELENLTLSIADAKEIIIRLETIASQLDQVRYEITGGLGGDHNGALREAASSTRATAKSLAFVVAQAQKPNV